MCANLGWFNLVAPTAKKKELLKHMARKSQVFGDKSFGLAAKKDGEVVLVRYTAAPSQWLEQNSKDLEKYASSLTMLGHTRLPTHGAVTKVNCHPFPLGDWLACHNGVIHNSSKLLLKARLTARGETDSEEALAFVVGEGWSKEALKEVEGSYAFVGLKKDLRSGLLICDDRQSLYYIKVGDGIVWSTSAEILVSSLNACGIQHGDPQKLDSEILVLPTLQVEKFEVASSITRYRWGEDSGKGGRSGKGRTFYATEDGLSGLNADEPPFFHGMTPAGGDDLPPMD